MIALFIVLSIVLLVVIFYIIFHKRIFNSYILNNYVKYYGRKTYKIARDFDYYLINQISLENHDNTTVDIDHLLFGNKFLYVISDYYFRGCLKAKEIDNSWIFKPNNKDEKAHYVDNLIIKSKALTRDLANVTSLDEKLFIPIVVVNQDCLIEEYEHIEGNPFLVRINQLRKLVETIEKRNVAPLEERQVYFAVRDIARLNQNKRHIRKVK